MKKMTALLCTFFLVLTLAGCGQTPAAPSGSELPVEDSGAPVYIYLTRHGETITNRTGRMVSGRGSTPLTEEGRQVASTVGVGLSGVKFVAAYASPLGRTQETARLILEQSQTSWDLPIQSVEDLREIDGGSFEPMSYAELMKNQGMNFNTPSVEIFQNQFSEKDPEGLAESYQATGERTMAALEEICRETAESGGGNVLVVAHGGVNGNLAAQIIGKTELESLANSSVVLISYQSGKYEVVSYNDQSYGDNARAAMENPAPVEVYLTTNAQTVTDSQNRLCGVLDTDLTEEGHAEAAQLGQSLKDVLFSAVYTSDQCKDSDTAALILAENVQNPDLKAHQTVNLRGISCGYFDGELKTVTDALAPVGASAKARLDAYGAADPTGMVEPYADARERLLNELRTICQRQRSLGGGNVLLVTSELARQLLAEEFDASVSADGMVRITFDGTNYIAA